MLTVLLAFIGTNVDGFLCLGAAFAVDPPHSRARAVFVAACGFLAILAISFAVSLAIGRVGIAAAWFGLLPAGIGVIRLVRLGLRAGDRENGDWISSAPSLFSIVLATGADNVAVYSPLFAVHALAGTLGICAVYLLLWIAGCAALGYLTPNLSRINALRRGLEPALAILFIIIGARISLC